jgi:hypothetical protein
MFTKIIRAHYFFVENTPEYIITKYEEKYCMGEMFRIPVFSLRQKLYYPIAYIKFMYLSLKDLIK